MGEREAHSERVLPLVALVRECVDASGLGIRGFARQRGIKYGTLRRYYDKKMLPLVQGVKPDTLKALATALDLPLSRVQWAHDQSLSRLYQSASEDGRSSVTIAVDEAFAALPEQQRRAEAERLFELIKEYLPTSE
jgi:hypothetical protein